MTIAKFQFVTEGPLQKARCDEVPNLMVIAGPNGVGKSTLLENLRNPSEYTTIEGEGMTYISTRGDLGRKCVYYAPHRSPTTRGIGLGDLVEMDEYDFATLMSSSQGRNLPGVPGNVRSRLIGDRVPYTAVKKRMADFKRKKRDLLEIAHEDEDIDIMEAVPDLVDPLQNAIEDVLPGLEFTEIDQNENDQYILRFSDQNDNTVTFDELSSGEKDIISMLFLAVEDEILRVFEEAGIEDVERQDLVVLVDGPEAYLHPDLQRRFVRFLNEYTRRIGEEERDVQFIMATHSKAIIDSVPPDSIYFLQLPDAEGTNQLQKIGSIGPEGASDIMGDMGLLALSAGRHLFLVEGPTDRDILTLLYPKIEQEFTIVPMEGKDRVKDIETFNRLVTELVNSGREVYAVLDADRENQVDEALEDRVHVLPCTCIENIILRPEPIYEAVRAWVDPSRGDVSGVDSADDVREKIEDIISSQSFIQEEVWTRFNEEFNPLNISRRDFYYRPESDFEDYAIDVVRDRIADTRGVSQIEQEVQNIVDDEEWGKLDGKRIVHELSTEFSLDDDRFARIVAEKMEEMGAKPTESTGFIEDICDRVT